MYTLLHLHFINWRKIKKYTSEELEFLAELAKGTTLIQEERREKSRDYEEFKNKRTKYTTNWKEFSHALGSKGTLKRDMRREEELEKEKKGYRRY